MVAPRVSHAAATAEARDARTIDAMPAAHDQLRIELTATRDEQRSGAVDIAWPGAEASLFFVFGQPSHATVSLDTGERMAGLEALDHLLGHLPDTATVQPWRRVMVPEDTLRLSVDELLCRLGGEAGLVPPPPPALGHPMTVADFPLLPLGVSLWSDAAANVVHLDMLAPKLPDSLVVLTADGVRAATVIASGSIVDSVYVDAASCLLGDEATDALMRTSTGTISGYGLDDERLLASIPLLWRSRRAITGLHASWIDVDRMVADIRESGQSCALLVSGEHGGAALFHDGQLVGSYTEQRRTPSGSPAALRALLRAPGATVSVLSGAPSLAVERALAEEAFHQFIAAPVAEEVKEEDVAGPVASEAVLAPDPGGNGSAAPALPLFPPDVFALPDLEPPLPEPEAAAPPVPAAVPTAAAGDVAHDELEPITAGAETLATISLAPPVADAGAPPPPVEDSEPEAAVDHADDGRRAAEPAAAAAALADDAAASTAAGGGPNEAGDAEFVPARLEFDVAALRRELIDIATVWLGQADVGPVSRIIKRTRPGVDEFVGAVARIGSLQVPGHEPAVVRAMAREMHFRVAEVLCAV